jgi:hypothetical protein
MEQAQEVGYPADADLERELERELGEVEAAIALVRSGIATVVTIANLRHGDDVLDRLQRQGGPDVEFEPFVWHGQVKGELTVRLISA